MNFEAALINVALLWLLTTPHEFAHAWVATKLGDDTPRLQGLVALAGPASNVVFAVVLAAVAAATAHANVSVANFAAQGVRLSLYLALFNMIPVPPLDGSKLLLAARIPVEIYSMVARYGFLLLILLMAYTQVGITLSGWSYDAARTMLGWFRPL
jgi:Zn-dependent protease